MPPTMVKIKIRKEIGEDCITLEEGQKIYEQIYPDLEAGKPVILDFEEVKFLTAPFLNAAIGRLLKKIEKKKVQDLLVDKITGLDQQRKKRIERIIEYKTNYYNNLEVRQAVDQVLQEISDSPDAYV